MVTDRSQLQALYRTCETLQKQNVEFSEKVQELQEICTEQENRLKQLKEQSQQDSTAMQQMRAEMIEAISKTQLGMTASSEEGSALQAKVF